MWEYLYDIRCITSGNIRTKCSINFIISRDILQISTKLSFIIVQEFNEALIQTIIISEIENTDISKVYLRGCIIVCDEIEVVCCVLIFSLIDVHDGMGLEPCAYVSEFTFNYSYWPKIRIIIIYLIYWVSPSISNADTCQSKPCSSDKTLVSDNFSS